MSLSVKCPACGHMNPLGRLFCAKCGGKIEVTDRTLRSAREPGQGAWALTARLIRLLVFLGLLFSLYLLSRPVAPEGRLGTRSDGALLAQKMNLLHAAAETGRSEAQDATEAEVNGYIAELLKNTMNRTAGGALQFELQQINFAFRGDGRIVVVFSTQWKAFSLTYEFTCRASAGDGSFGVTAEGLRMGRLPLPAAVARWSGARMARVFGQLERERRLLDRLSGLEIRQGEATARMGGY